MSKNSTNTRPKAVQALVQLIDSGKRISANIDARMLLHCYPSSATVKVCLTREMEAVAG